MLPYHATEKLTVESLISLNSGGLHFNLDAEVVQTPQEVPLDTLGVAVRQVPAAEVRHHLGGRLVDYQTHRALRRPALVVELYGWKPWKPDGW